MRKAKAVKLKPGTLVFFWRQGAAYVDYQLGEVMRVTPRGGVLVTPVVEEFGDCVRVTPIGSPEWVPYSRVQIAFS